MRYLIQASLLVLILSSCQEKEIQVLEDPVKRLSFEYTEINVDDPKTYKVNTVKHLNKRSSWYVDQTNDGKFRLAKSIYINSKNNENEDISFQIEVEGFEDNQNLLTLLDESLRYYKRDWDYKSTAVEVNNFWKNEDKRILIDFNNKYLRSDFSEIDVVHTKKVIVDGEEKTFVSIRFSGEAFGYYDPDKKFPGYMISNGVFEGVIE